jgi:hypothetical protein
VKSSQKNARKGSSTGNASKGSRRESGGDLVSGKLGSLGRKLGNEALESRMQDANQDQKKLLDFVLERLKNVQHVQLAELKEMKDSRDWFREVARGKDGFTLPDTTRWHECALLYQRAGRALCRGDLGRGAQLLEQATKSELEAQTSTPDQVKENLQGPAAAQVEAPDSASQLSTAAACRATAEPQELKIADRIRSIHDVMEDSPPIPIPGDRQWWEEEKEEEDEDGED